MLSESGTEFLGGLGQLMERGVEGVESGKYAAALEDAGPAGDVGVVSPVVEPDAEVARLARSVVGSSPLSGTGPKAGWRSGSGLEARRDPKLNLRCVLALTGVGGPVGMSGEGAGILILPLPLPFLDDSRFVNAV